MNGDLLYTRVQLLLSKHSHQQIVQEFITLQHQQYFQVKSVLVGEIICKITV